MAHQEIGRELVNKMVEEVQEFGAVESPPKKMGNTFSVVLGPVKLTKK
jgi:translation initiation factor IF-3